MKKQDALRKYIVWNIYTNFFEAKEDDWNPSKEEYKNVMDTLNEREKANCVLRARDIYRKNKSKIEEPLVCDKIEEITKEDVDKVLSQGIGKKFS